MWGSLKQRAGTAWDSTTKIANPNVGEEDEEPEGFVQPGQRSQLESSEAIEKGSEESLQALLLERDEARRELQSLEEKLIDVKTSNDSLVEEKLTLASTVESLQAQLQGTQTGASSAELYGVEMDKLHAEIRNLQNQLELEREGVGGNPAAADLSDRVPALIAELDKVEDELSLVLEERDALSRRVEDYERNDEKSSGKADTNGPLARAISTVLPYSEEERVQMLSAELKVVKSQLEERERTEQLRLDADVMIEKRMMGLENIIAEVEDENDLLKERVTEMERASQNFEKIMEEEKDRVQQAEAEVENLSSALRSRGHRVLEDGQETGDAAVEAATNEAARSLPKNVDSYYGREKPILEEELASLQAQLSLAQEQLAEKQEELGALTSISSKANEQLREITQERDDALSERTKLEANVNLLDGEVKSLREDLDRARTDKSAARAIRPGLSDSDSPAGNSRKQELEAHRERVQELEKEMDSMREVEEELRQTLKETGIQMQEDHEMEISLLEATLADMKASLAKVEGENEEMKKKVSQISEHNESASTSVSDRSLVIPSTQEDRNALQEMQSQLENISKEKQKLEVLLEERIARNDSLENIAGGLRSEAEGLKSTISNSDIISSEMKRDLELLKASLKESNEQLAQLQRENVELQGETGSLKDLQSAYDSLLSEKLNSEADAEKRETELLDLNQQVLQAQSDLETVNVNHQRECEEHLKKEKKIAELEEELRASRDAEAEGAQQLRSLQEELKEDHEMELSVLEATISDLRTKLASLSDEKDELENQKRIDAEKYSEQLRNAEEELKEDREMELSVMEATITELRATVSALTSEKNEREKQQRIDAENNSEQLLRVERELKEDHEMELSVMEATVSDLKAKLSSLTSKNEELEEQQRKDAEERSEQQLSVQRELKEDHEMELSVMEATLSDLKAKLSSLAGEKDEMEKQKQNDAERYSEITQESMDLKSSLQEAKSRLSELEGENSALTADLSKLGSESEIAAKNNLRAVELEKTISSLREEQSDLQAQMQQMELQKNEDHEMEITLLEQTVAELKSNLQKIETESGEIRVKLEETLSDLAVVESERDNFRAEANESRGTEHSATDLQQKLSDLQERLELKNAESEELRSKFNENQVLLKEDHEMEISVLEARLSDLQQTLDLKTAESEELQATLNEGQLQLKEDHEMEISVLEARLSDLTACVTELQNEKRDLSDKLQGLEQSDERQRSLQEDVNAKAQWIAEMENSKSDLEQEVESLKQERSDALEQLATMTQSLDFEKENRVEERRRLEALQTKWEELLVTLDNEREMMVTSRESVSNLEGVISELEATIQKQKTALTSLEMELAETKAERDQEVLQALTTKEEEFGSAKLELISQMESLEESRKELLEKLKSAAVSTEEAVEQRQKAESNFANLQQFMSEKESDMAALVETNRELKSENATLIERIALMEDNDGETDELRQELEVVQKSAAEVEKARDNLNSQLVISQEELLAMREQKEAADMRLEGIQEEFAVLKEERDDIYAELGAIKEEQIALKEERDKLGDQLAALHEEEATFRNEKDAVNEEILSLRENNDFMRQERDELNEQLATLDARLSASEAAKEHAQRTAEESALRSVSEAEVARKEMEIRNQGLVREVEELKTSQDALITEIAVLNGKLDTTEAERIRAAEAAEKSSSQLSLHLDEAKSASRSLQDELAGARAANNEEILSLRAELSKLRGKLEVDQEAKAALEIRGREVTASMVTVQNELEMAKEEQAETVVLLNEVRKQSERYREEVEDLKEEKDRLHSQVLSQQENLAQLDQTITAHQQQMQDYTDQLTDLRARNQHLTEQAAQKASEATDDSFPRQQETEIPQSINETLGAASSEEILAVPAVANVLDQRVRAAEVEVTNKLNLRIEELERNLLSVETEKQSIQDRFASFETRQFSFKTNEQLAVQREAESRNALAADGNFSESADTTALRIETERLQSKLREAAQENSQLQREVEEMRTRLDEKVSCAEITRVVWESPFASRMKRKARVLMTKASEHDWQMEMNNLSALAQRAYAKLLDKYASLTGVDKAV